MTLIYYHLTGEQKDLIVAEFKKFLVNILTVQPPLSEDQFLGFQGMLTGFRAFLDDLVLIITECP